MPIRKTLRFRLAVWNTLTVLATAALILIALRQGVRWATLHEMDQILVEDAEEVALALHERSDSDLDQLTEDFDRKARNHRHHEWFVQLLDGNQRVVWASSRTPSSELPIAREDRFAPYQVGNFRVVQRAVRPEMSEVAMIRVGVALTLLNQDIAKIDRLVLALVVLTLIMAPLVGYWLASRIAGWIGEIILTASRLRPDCLDERLPVRGTGDELDQLAETVNRLLDRVGESLKQKRDFLANSAHELRTPLAAIRSSVEVALVSQRSHEEYEDLLVNILEQGGALEKLVNQLLLISESEVQLNSSGFSTRGLFRFRQRKGHRSRRRPACFRTILPCPEIIFPLGTRLRTAIGIRVRRITVREHYRYRSWPQHLPGCHRGTPW